MRPGTASQQITRSLARVPLVPACWSCTTSTNSVKRGISQPCRASESEQAGQQESEAPTSAAPPPPRVSSNLPPGRAPPPRPVPTGMRVERVERLGEESWAGVAAVDRGERDNSTDWGRVAVLAGGDAAALLLFASIGRASHAEGLSIAGTLATAAPFLLGWFAAAPLLGGFGSAARGGDARAAAVAGAKSWAVGIPAGLALRSLYRGYLPDKAFIIVSMVATAVLLVGWRAALAAATPRAEGEAAAGPAPEVRRRKNTRGNPLEFVGLLMSLVKRW